LPAPEKPTVQRCLDAAFRYLSYRPRSEAELRQRLKRRGFDSSSIERALILLKEQGLVDDVAFARFWKENRDSFSPRGRKMLESELKLKGVDPEIIVETLAGLDEESSAYEAARKKVKGGVGSDYFTFCRRLIAFLRRRGFSYEVARHTVNRLWREEKGGDPGANYSEQQNFGAS
jgi:regulatory protein